MRLGAKVQRGQTVLVTGALGAVGRSAVFAAAEIGARIIAGVRGKRLDAARQLHGVVDAIAIDDEAEIDKLGLLDCIADTIGGKVAGKLLSKIKQGGSFGCFPSTLQDAALHPSVHINSVYAKVNTATTLHYAEAVRDGKLTIPVNRIMSLADAAAAQAAVEKGGIAKIVLTA
jgi:NADPH:quinone reductase-like Zn-dependent oxidoreductase